MKGFKIIYLVLAALLLALSFVGGCQYHKKTFKCPVMISDTVLIHDTVIHHIPGIPPGYITKHDSVIIRDTIFKDIDTAAILRDYYSINYLTQIWKDSLLSANNEIAISENQIIDSKFNYTILHPQQIIINTVNNYSYDKYLYGTISVPLNDVKFINLGISFASKGFLLGIGYIPYYKGVNVSMGIKIAKFKE